LDYFSVGFFKLLVHFLKVWMEFFIALPCHT
jgi:hypothetical protein